MTAATTTTGAGKPSVARMFGLKGDAWMRHAWYIDRMVLLFDAMKGRNAEYASWDY